MCISVLGGTKQAGLKSLIKSPAEGSAGTIFSINVTPPWTPVGSESQELGFYESEMFEIL